MHLAPFVPAHLAGLELQPMQVPRFGGSLNVETAAGLRRLGPAFAALDGGRVMACWGVADIWPGRGDCWALLDNGLTGGRFVVLHRWVARNLNVAQRLGYRRLETTIDPDFPEARRWAERLGFRCEGRLRRYLPDGRDMLLYARTP